MNHCSPKCRAPYGSTTSQLVNSSSPGQTARHFADDIFKCFFLNENVYISIYISLKFVPDVKLIIFQYWFRLWLGADQATSHYLSQWWPSLVTRICVTRPQCYGRDWFRVIYGLLYTPLYLYTPMWWRPRKKCSSLYQKKVFFLVSA